MARAGTLLLILMLLLPVAAAQAADAAPVEPALPDQLRDAAASAGATLAGAGAAAASATASGAAAVGDALAALGHALASAAQAIAGAVASAARALGAALAAAGSALASGVAAAVAVLASAAAAAFAFLASLAAGGADYARAHPKETAIAAGSATGLATMAWLLKRFGGALLLPLYTRLAPSQMLDNAARARVYEHVRANPGAHPSAIAQALDLGWGTVIYHLGKLEDSKLVVAKAAHHRKCYFATGSDLGADARTAVAAMAHDKAKLIVATVRETPGITQKQLAERVGMSQALASWHVKRLVTSGVLLTVREGRSNALRVAEHVPAAGAPTPVAIAA